MWIGRSIGFWHVLGGIFLWVSLPGWGGAQEQKQSDGAVEVYGYPAKLLNRQLFARIDDKSISMAIFEQAVFQAVRNRFYHRKPDDDQMDKVRQKVANELIDARLLVMEGRQQGIALETKEMSAALAQYEKGLVPDSGPDAQALHAGFLQEKRITLLAARAIEMLRERVESTIQPDPGTLQSYYHSHIDKFTQPPRQRVSMILLKVPPSAPSNQWKSAFSKAEALYTRISNGESFAELARAFSNHESADQGGDLGYLHQGMLVDELQSKIDALKVGEVTHPAWTLQGIVMFQLNALSPSKRMSYESVRDRVQELWLRDEQKLRWQRFVSGLRKKYADHVTINRLVLEG